MDSDRFDVFTRSLTDARSRRGALTTLVGGMVGLLGLADTAAKKSKHAHGEGKKKKKKKKKKGRGTSQPLDASPPSGDPAPPPPPPPPPFCASQPDDTECNGGKCLNGVCNPRPSCTATGGGCTPGNDSACCSNWCGFACETSKVGDPCYTNVDCRSGLVCVGFRCEYTLCAEGKDICQDATATCGSGRDCFQPLGGGRTRCGKPTDTGSCGCTSHEECVANHGSRSGAFCVEITGTRCTCGGAATFCAVH